ncbi:tyrosyl-DNA phosphodiesterase 2-like [Dermacentor albipictus]|uniref:tyrosyl-DNA phosphodiesterase 2-like n=1 Tax=Dermacentor albipictus TaxID=60249 RepID=UPI0031FC704C
MLGEISATRGSGTPKTAERPPQIPGSLKFITWYTNGLDFSNRLPRTRAVCSAIRSADPDVVFLQEVVLQWDLVLREAFEDYTCVRKFSANNFTFTMLKRATTKFEGYKRRRLATNNWVKCEVATIEASFAGLPITLVNARLEPDPDKSKLRKHQLSKCFKACLEQPPNRTVIFGGNLGLRGHELNDVGGRPRSLVDVWEHCGRRREACYTWDMTVNDNHPWNTRKKPQHRTDRVYVRAAKPATMAPVSFDLIGMERISPVGCFPSDHWGLLCRFNLL